MFLKPSEIWGTASGPYIISYGFNGDDDTRSSPVTYAGTQWYYYLDAQFLWALGNTTMDVDVYVSIIYALWLKLHMVYKQHQFDNEIGI